MFDIAVILINYNSSEYTVKCVESIINKTNKNLNYQIIIIDNGSKIESYLKLKKELASIEYPEIILKRSKINTGFGGGNMLGVQEANSRYYAFINNDSVLINDCLSIIIEAMENNSEYGICGPKAFTENQKLLPTLDHFASLSKELFGRRLLEFFNTKEYPNRYKDYQQPQKGQFISGSFMVLKAEDFNRVGGFDTNIFLYYEETDLCKRLRQINKFAYLIPDAEFTHYHGASTPKSILIKTELKISLLYVIRKHYGYFKYKTLLTHLQTKYFISSIFKPKYWYLFKVLITGAHISNSIKQNQTISHE